MKGEGGGGVGVYGFTEFQYRMGLGFFTMRIVPFRAAFEGADL